MTKFIRRLWPIMALSLGMLFLTWPVQAEEKMTADEIAKELSNPTTPLASLNTSLVYSKFKGDLPNASDQDSWRLESNPCRCRFRSPTATVCFSGRWCRSCWTSPCSMPTSWISTAKASNWATFQVTLPTAAPTRILVCSTLAGCTLPPPRPPIATWAAGSGAWGRKSRLVL